MFMTCQTKVIIRAKQYVLFPFCPHSRPGDAVYRQRIAKKSLLSKALQLLIKIIKFHHWKFSIAKLPDFS